MFTMSVKTETRTQPRVLDLAYIALMAALLAICAWITIPFGPVPFTMQTFGVFAALGLLGGRRGTFAILVYLALGLVGLPVFSGFSGGAGQLLGPTGGYLIGFIVAALVFWAVTARFEKPSLPILAGALVLVMVVYYAFGTAWFLQVYTGENAGSLMAALTMCVFPYIIPDLIKLALALLVTRRVGPYVH